MRAISRSLFTPLSSPALPQLSSSISSFVVIIVTIIIIIILYSGLLKIDNTDPRKHKDSDPSAKRILIPNADLSSTANAKGKGKGKVRVPPRVSFKEAQAKRAQSVLFPKSIAEQQKQKLGGGHSDNNSSSANVGSRQVNSSGVKDDSEVTKKIEVYVKTLENRLIRTRW